MAESSIYILNGLGTISKYLYIEHWEQKIPRKPKPFSLPGNTSTGAPYMMIMDFGEMNEQFILRGVVEENYLSKATLEGIARTWWKDLNISAQTGFIRINVEGEYYSGEISDLTFRVEGGEPERVSYVMTFEVVRKGA